MASICVLLYITEVVRFCFKKLAFCSCAFVLLSPIKATGQSSRFYDSTMNGAWSLAVIDSLDAISTGSISNIKASGKKCVIKVTNQKEFDKVNETLSNAIVSGYKNVKLKIGKGTYAFHEEHISINNLDASDVSVTIEANKKTIITSAEEYGAWNTDPWSELTSADGLIKVIDLNNRICFIPFNNRYSDSYRKVITKVQTTQWYKSPVYDVIKNDSTGIYFIAPDLKYVDGFKKDEFNVNYDYIYHDCLPRFRLYNSSISYRCNASKFINIRNSNFKSFSISGLYVSGNKPGPALISIENVKTESFSIRRSRFCYIRGRVASFKCTDNILFDQNYVYNSSGDEVEFVKGCKYVRVTNNLFDYCGRSIKNSFCVTCKEAEYYIANNVFKDFGYGAIGVGVWHGLEKIKPSIGIIEYNEIYYSKEYYANYLNHTLMDSGAIYVWTQNDRAVIRYNYIHDYTGAGDNRGIFCDDGASNICIYCNLVMNIPNCYSIDSRKTMDQRPGVKNNSNNFLAYNIVSSSIRFMGYGDEDRHCLKGKNVVIKIKSGNQIESLYCGLKVSENDDVLELEDYRGLSKKVGRKIIKGNPRYKEIKQYF